VIVVGKTVLNFSRRIKASFQSKTGGDNSSFTASYGASPQYGTDNLRILAHLLSKI
jgi:hypothetical protein